MARNLVLDPARVFAFVSERVALQPIGGVRGIGLEQDGRLVAGVLYEGYTGNNIWMHVAAEPGSYWATREFLGAVFNYPFVQLKLDRVSGYVEASNLAARRLNERLGFKREAVLERAARDGGDVILYVLWKKDCRYHHA